MADRDELEALRRLAELEAKAGGAPAAPALNPMQRRMGLGHQGATGQGIADTAVHYGLHYPDEAGTAATDWATGKGMAPETAAKFGYAANVGSQIPSVLLGLGAGSAAKPAMQGTGEWLMGKALRPSQLDWRTGKADRAISTMLEDGYSPTRGGVDAMRSQISDLGDEVSNIISSSTKNLDKQALIDRLQAVKDKALRLVNPEPDLAAIEAVGKGFDQHRLIANTTDVPIQLAQQIKQATGRELGDASYGMGLKPAAERDAKKALVRALKEDISAAEPAVAPLNAREGDLLNAVKIAERSAASQRNVNPLPLGASIAAIAHDPMAALGMYANSSAAVKAALARLLYTGSKGAPVAGAAAGATYGATQGEQ